MNRFTEPNDKIEWAKGPFYDGMRARFDGICKDSVPSIDVIGLFANKSWLAGWLDADASICADGLDIPIN